MEMLKLCFYKPVLAFRYKAVKQKTRCVDLFRYVEYSLLGAGGLVDVPDPTLLHADLTAFIGDEAALKAIWQVKGQGGVKPCFKCSNIIKKQAI